MVQAKFLTGKEIEQSIARLMSEHDEFHWAVAWGTETPIARELIGQAAKFRNVTFGVAFSQTDPDLVDALVGVKNGYIATKFSGGTYHPKVYCFRSGNRAAALIGSANFTRGGLGVNLEAALEITGGADDPVFADALSFTRRCAKECGEPVTPAAAAQYRLSHRLARRLPKAPRNPLAGAQRDDTKALQSGLVEMSWDEYASAIRQSKTHKLNTSLSLLRTAQGWLSSAQSFRDLSTSQRQALGGVLGASKKVDIELDQDWGWFGSMRGMGDFANRIKENDSFLARAVDSIPHKGEVTREHYDRFADLFVKAFRNSQRVGAVPTASRLLAMKRPDVFVCVSRPNIESAAAKMGFAKSTLKLENYWDRVVDVIRAADWYQAIKPDGADGELWETRAAMLDAMLYKP